MLIQSPDRNWSRLQSSHPDHLAAGEAAIQAIYPDAENPFAHTSLLNDEGLEAWKVNEIWVMASPTPNTYVDITDDFEAKLDAINAHASQLPPDLDVRERVGMWMSMQAQEGGLEDGRLAEAFMVVTK
jgi:LmbE family N-acetylglucosaminyl deacetylase